MHLNVNLSEMKYVESKINHVFTTFFYLWRKLHFDPPIPSNFCTTETKIIKIVQYCTQLLVSTSLVKLSYLPFTVILKYLYTHTEGKLC